ncbi:putative pseudouridine synthase C1A4.09 isoform X2 [Chenopodium quinoa]|uniref:putative pseudouridine synthase C1A4.09 isoform X2 n=1 Tax=Chenopodium quinoa TaxID=63459 RepID=UPI000B76D795|nr:putative pseudouridine synthase C1A4.09 isoform X2 [Chenopodium quinoa]
MTADCSTAVDNLTGDSQADIINAPQKSIDEPDVGILCYISHLPGLRGILKQRYSDFIVNEVDLNGNVVHLTSLHVSPKIPSPFPSSRHLHKSGRTTPRRMYSLPILWDTFDRFHLCQQQSEVGHQEMSSRNNHQHILPFYNQLSSLFVTPQSK